MDKFNPHLHGVDGAKSAPESLSNSKHEDLSIEPAATTQSSSSSSGILQSFGIIASSHITYTCLTLLGAVLCYTILFTPNVHSCLDRDTNLREAFLNGPVYHSGMLVGTTLLVPLVVDELLDFIQYFLVPSHGRKKITWKTVHNAPERFIFMLGMSLDDFSSRVPITTRNALVIWHCTNRAQSMIVGGILFAAESRQDSAFAPPVWSWIMYLAFICGNAIVPFAANHPSNPRLMMAANMFCYISAIIFATAMIRSGWRCFHQLRTGRSHPTAASSSSQEEGFLVYHFVKVCSILLWTILKVWADAWTPNIISCVDSDLFVLCIPDIIFQFFLLVFTMRLVKYEAIETHFALDAEKQYVRCITHELSKSNPDQPSTTDITATADAAAGVGDGDGAFKEKRSKRSVSFHESSINGGEGGGRGRYSDRNRNNRGDGEGEGNGCEGDYDPATLSIAPAMRPRRHSHSRSRRSARASLRAHRSSHSREDGGLVSGSGSVGAGAVSSLGSTYEEDLQEDLEVQMKLQRMLGRILVRSEHLQPSQQVGVDSDSDDNGGGVDGDGNDGGRIGVPDVHKKFPPASSGVSASAMQVGGQRGGMDRSSGVFQVLSQTESTTSSCMSSDHWDGDGQGEGHGHWQEGQGQGRRHEQQGQQGQNRRQTHEQEQKRDHASPVPTPTVVADSIDEDDDAAEAEAEAEADRQLQAKLQRMMGKMKSGVVSDTLLSRASAHLARAPHTVSVNVSASASGNASGNANGSGSTTLSDASDIGTFGGTNVSGITGATAVTSANGSVSESVSVGESGCGSGSDAQSSHLYRLRPPLPSDWEMNTDSSSSPRKV